MYFYYKWYTEAVRSAASNSGRLEFKSFCETDNNSDSPMRMLGQYYQLFSDISRQ
jgi:hypothetical protein